MHPHLVHDVHISRRTQRRCRKAAKMVKEMGCLPRRRAWEMAGTLPFGKEGRNMGEVQMIKSAGKAQYETLSVPVLLQPGNF